MASPSGILANRSAKSCTEFLSELDRHVPCPNQRVLFPCDPANVVAQVKPKKMPMTGDLFYVAHPFSLGVRPLRTAPGVTYHAQCHPRKVHRRTLFFPGQGSDNLDPMRTLIELGSQNRWRQKGQIWALAHPLPCPGLTHFYSTKCHTVQSSFQPIPLKTNDRYPGKVTHFFRGPSR